MLNICEELSKNFIDFAAEANGQRAFPDARDGLKPGQRACLWEMYTKGYLSSKPHVKSAKIDGGVAATWWPHGTTAIYDTFARMSMPWINNIPEVDFHGSNGNVVIGNTPAADRYTEARLDKASEEGFFQGMSKKPVPMIKNFSEDEEWPEVFPAIFPRLMVNGSQGIGVAVAQTWLPTNLNELGEVIKEYIQTNEIDYTKLYPDFPTAGIIINKNEVSNIYKTGKGRVVLRGKATIEKNSILITEFPYQVYIEEFVDAVKTLVKNENLTGISEIYNKSDKKHLLVEIVCEDNPERILKMLYAKTDLQKTFNANQYALVGKTPKLFTLKDYLDSYIKHNLSCICNEYEFDLQKAQEKLEITQGLIKALEHIDKIIELIKSSDSANCAAKVLQDKYNFTEKQANAIVNIKLGRLAKLESVELNKTEQGLLSDIEKFNNILSNVDNQKNLLLTRLNNFIKKFGFERRTQLLQLDEPKEDKEIIEVIPQECIVSVTESNLIKKTPSANYKSQKRGGTGIRNKDDIISFTCKTNTQDNLMVFSSKGKMYKILVDKIPEKSTRIDSLITFESNEKPMAYASLYKDSPAEFVFFITKQGYMKKVPIAEFTKMKKNSGISAINFHDNDELAAVTFINSEDMLLATKQGMCIHIATNFNPASRISMGVKGINLREDDEVLTCLPIHKVTDELLVVDELGNGKRLELREFPLQNRGGLGLVISKNPLVGLCLVDDKDKILITGNKNTICIDASSVPSVLTRASIGNMLIKNNRVMSVSKI